MIVLNSIFPVFAIIFMGIVLKRIRLTQEVFLSAADRLIYYAFFPLLLFWKIGRSSTIEIDWAFCGACISAVISIYGVSLVCIKIFKVGDFQAGTFSQSCIRFNTYIGIAIVMNAAGERGILLFGVLIGFMIPLINVLSVATLIWYSGKHYPSAQRNRILARALFSNPLILGCIAGIVYAYTVGRFPAFIDNTFELAGSLTLPLALISIGGGLTFSGIQKHYPQALIASILKLLVLPLTGYGFLTLFNVGGLSLFVGMIYFSLPTSSVIYILSGQLNSDIDLAYTSIVVSTIFSAISMTVALTGFKILAGGP